MKNTVLVGITGGIASGKSIVSDFLEAQGYPVIDADTLGHRVLEQGHVGYQKVLDVFGTSILNEDQSISRQKLGRIVFSNPESRLRLNQVVHPLIGSMIQEELKLYAEKNHPVVFLDAALLIESRWRDFCKHIWLVWAEKELCIQRLCTRNSFSRHEAKQRINSQISHEARIPYATVIFENNKSIKSLLASVTQALQELLL